MSRPGERAERSVPFPADDANDPSGCSGPGGSVYTLPTAVYGGWEAIYADNVGWLFRLMYAKVGNAPDAEDLTSQVFVNALGPMRAGATVAQVRRYLRVTARTVLARHWQRTLGHEVTEIIPEELGDGPLAPGSTRADDDTAERARRILAGLPERQSQILRLRFLCGYSLKDAARELGITVANAKVLQHRALRAAAQVELDEQPS